VTLQFLAVRSAILATAWLLVLENSRTCKVPEHHSGPGKSWKNILESHAFSSGSNGKQAAIV